MYDMKNLAKLKLLDANAAQGMKAFWAFDKAAMAEGAIPVKYKELMALAVAFTTQCPYCIEVHSNQARSAGASDQEIAEAVVVAGMRFVVDVHELADGCVGIFLGGGKRLVP
jgi:AhpD family alkylhydroperoxidase